MKRYFKVEITNGFCGCDKEYGIVTDGNTPSECDILNNYSFYEPDDRFCDTEDEEEVEAYQEGIEVEVTEYYAEEDFYLNVVDEGLSVEKLVK